MGCWNETCVLTRLPIRVGMPVVALTTVHGPQYKATEGSGQTGLLFGLPQIGEYDDYGGVENLALPQLEELHQRAFRAAGYYKEWTFKNDYGGAGSWWLASHPDTLWALTENVKPVFYPELGLRLAEVGSYSPEAQAKTTEAYKRASKALEELGKKLETLVLSDIKETAQDQLFSVFEDIFGKERAWAAWSAIHKNGLFAGRSQMLMHKAAYDAMVLDFGMRKVGRHSETKRYTLREYLEQQFDAWMVQFPAEYEKCLRLFGDPDVVSNVFEQRKRALRYANSKREFSHLCPMTSMWMAPEVPLVGHFWGAATPEEILAVVPRSDIIDYFVFQWARHYLRVDLTAPNGGSQNQEVVLPANILKATLKVLKEKDFVKKDFDGTLFY